MPITADGRIPHDFHNLAQIVSAVHAAYPDALQGLLREEAL